jgi:hypothetical protein
MPSRQTVDKALAAIKEPAAYEYFFDQLKSPSWIAPLRERGFFQKPPGGEVEDEYIRFPYWPESRYLARMASVDPELVFEVLRSIPDTMNPRVQGDIVDALVAMPPTLSARLAKRVGSWISSRYSLLLPQKLSELVISLVRGGKLKAGITLAYELLAPADISLEEGQNGQKLRAFEPQPQYDIWSYEQVANKIIPVLAEVDKEKTLKLLADLLEAAGRQAAFGAEPPQDGSGIWRSTIETSDQNGPANDLRDVLIDHLRDTAYNYVQSEASNLDIVRAQLLERRWRIFHRIFYHVLATEIDANLPLARQLALDSSHFDDPDEYHEFWLLVRNVFPRLGPGDRQELLRLLETGPVETHGAEDPERYRQAWRLRRLAVLRDVLDPTERRTYDSLASAVGYEPERPDLLVYTSGMWLGPTAPKEASELDSMATQEVVAFLRTWQPSDEFMSPSREGLARSLSTVVGTDPRRFAEYAEDMTDLDPTYIRAVIDGWATAAKEGRSFPWLPVLSFCLRTVERQPPSGATIEETRSSSEWQQVRRSITYLLVPAFSAEDREIPFALRDDVWALLELLVKDTDPTPEFEEQYGGSNMDPASLAINTTRGQAMHDVLRYALWIARTISKTLDDQDAGMTFAVMPEVRNVLIEHLNVASEPSAAVRSVYGQWLAWLYILDTHWTEEHLDSIFPDSAELAHLRDAAWNAYLFFSPLVAKVFALLRKQYAAAISRLRGAEDESESGFRPETPGVRVGQHVVIQLLRDELSLQDELVVEFFDQAPLDIRRQVLAHAGRITQDLARDDPAAVERAIDLWNSRVAARIDREDSELTAFGWWFVDTAFPADWALQQLSKTLSFTNGKIDHDYSVVIRLAEIANTDPVVAIRCLRLMLDRDRERGLILASADKVRDVLRVALASEQPGASQSAIDLIHILGAHGYREMRELLPDL